MNKVEKTNAERDQKNDLMLEVANNLELALFGLRVILNNSNPIVKTIEQQVKKLRGE